MNELDQDGGNALQSAIHNDHKDIVEYLIKKEAIDLLTMKDQCLND